jgi:hypothetical protein
MLQPILLLNIALASLLAVTNGSRLPAYTRGVYLLLADDTVTINGVPTIGDWQPVVGSWI